MIRKEYRAALYARFSSDNQRTESIDAQLRAMYTYCQQNNFTIVETYVDEAKSATSDRRPAFQQMITDSAKKGFDILLVHKLDRFARNRYDSAIYKRELRKNGVTVYSVLENLDNSPESIMLEAVLEGMNEYYSQNLSREVMKGLKENALQCKHTGGLPPLGYDVDPVTKQLVINPEEAEAVRLIFSMYAEGFGYSDILLQLSNRDFKTKTGNHFAKNSLRNILCNEKYSGTYIYNRSSPKSEDGTRNSHRSKSAEEIISIPGGCPQIVDSQTFRRVQQRMEENRRAGSGGRNNAKTNYLLSGKVFCKDCGRSMQGFTRHYLKKDYTYYTYRCPTPKQRCNNKEINKEYLEDYTIQLLEKHVFNAKAAECIAKAIDAQQKSRREISHSKRKEIEQELEATQIALQRIADAVADGLLSSILIERLNELEVHKKDLEAQLSCSTCLHTLEALAIDPLLIPAQYAEVKRHSNSPAYKTFIQSFVDRIDVGRYRVAFTFKTGLGIHPELNLRIECRQQEIYQKEAV